MNLSFSVQCYKKLRALRSKVLQIPLSVHQVGRKEMSRPPVRSIPELAKEFGISASKLGAIMQHDASAPKPALMKGGKQDRQADVLTNKRSYYVLSEMRAWWSNRGGEAK